MNPKFRHLTSLDAIDPLPKLGAKVDPSKPKASRAVQKMAELAVGYGKPATLLTPRQIFEQLSSRVTPLAPKMTHHAQGAAPQNRIPPRPIYGGKLHENMVQHAAGIQRQNEWLASLPKDAKIYGDEVVLPTEQVGALVEKWREANPKLVWKTRPDPRTRGCERPSRVIASMWEAARTVDPLAYVEHEIGSSKAVVWCHAEHVAAVEHCVRPLVPASADCEVRAYRAKATEGHRRT